MMFGTGGWAAFHIARIKSYLKAHEGLPASGPEMNVVVLASAVIIGLGSPLFAFVMRG